MARRRAHQLAAVQADDLYELVCERQGRPLAITSNRTPSDRYPLFPDPVAESPLDRLIDTSHQTVVNGPGYRPNKHPKNPASRQPHSLGIRKPLTDVTSVPDETLRAWMT